MYDSILMRRRSAALHSSNRSVAPTQEDKPVQHGARQDTVAPAEARVGPGRNNSRAEHRQGGDLRARQEHRMLRKSQATDKNYSKSFLLNVHRENQSHQIPLARYQDRSETI